MPRPRVRLQVDWDNDRIFDDTDGDLSADMLSWKMERGREHASVLEAVSTAGRLTAVLANYDGKYSPANTNSPLYPNIVQNRPVLLSHVPPLNSYGNFNGSTSKGQFAADADIQNVFTDGGTVEVLARPFSGGEDNTGYCVYKAWRFGVQGVQNGFARLRFYHNFSGSDGEWRTSNYVLPISMFSRAVVVYNKNSSNNNPTIYLLTLDGALQIFTVGDGLDRNMTPTGTAESDVENVLVVGNNAGQTRAWDGDLDDCRLWNDERTAVEVEDNAFIEISVASPGLAMYAKLNGDLVDATGNVATGTATAITWRNSHIWYGFLHDIVPAPIQAGRKLAVLEAFGAFAQINEEQAELPMQTDVTTGAVIDDLLDEVGWPSADRDVDTGQSTMSRVWVKRQSGLRTLRAIEKTESGFLVEDRDGGIRFEDRHRRLLTPHTVIQATFDDAAGATLHYLDPRQQNPRQFIRNSFTVNVRQYTVGSLAVLWTLPESGASSPLLAPGESRTFRATYPVADSPAADGGVDAWTTLEENTDYEANTDSGGGGTDVSGDIAVSGEIKRGNSHTFTLTNNGIVAAYVTLLQARGTPVTQSDPISVLSEDAASIVKYRRRSIHLAEHYLSDSQDGQNWADYNVSVFAKEIPVLDLTLMANTSLVHALAAEALDISDRVTVKALTIATQLGIDEDFFLERIAASMGEDQVMRITYSLSPASAYSNFWILGTSELGTDTIPAY